MVALFVDVGNNALGGGKDGVERCGAASLERGKSLCCLLCAAAFGS
jgi:hypothetical protein